MSSLKLNLDAKPYVPKFMSTILPKAPQTNSNPQIKTHTSLSIQAKAYIPKSRKQAQTTQTQTPPPPQPKPKKVYKEYFIIDEDDKQQFLFDYDYMISFENWEICKETKLLSEDFLKHLEDFKIVESEQIKMNNANNKGKKNKYHEKRTKELDKKKEVDLSNFGRKDMSKEIALAEQFKINIDKEAEKDPVRFKITEFLNRPNFQTNTVFYCYLGEEPIIKSFSHISTVFTTP